MWLLLLAIGSHKFIIALCIGQQLVTNKVNRWLIVLYIATFSLTTIIGAGAGSGSVLFLEFPGHCLRYGHAPLLLQWRRRSECRHHTDAGDRHRVLALCRLLWGDWEGESGQHQSRSSTDLHYPGICHHHWSQGSGRFAQQRWRGCGIRVFITFKPDIKFRIVFAF